MFLRNKAGPAFRGLSISLALAALAPGVACAAELRELCPSRPGLGTPPCIVDKGHLLGELGVVDWTLDEDAESRTDTLLFGDLRLRYGLTDRSEVQFAWTSFGHQRERDKASGEIDKVQGVGDVELAYKHSLQNPDGDGLSIALQPFVTLPVGRSGIGSGDWGAGLLVPLSGDLNDTVQLQLTPEIDARVDEDGNGRHLAFGSVAGVAISLAEKVELTLEGSVFRDRDPMEAKTEALAGVSLAWQPSDNLQLDAGTAVGLNHDSEDVRLYVGVSRRF